MMTMIIMIILKCNFYKMSQTKFSHVIKILQLMNFMFYFSFNLESFFCYFT